MTSYGLTTEMHSFFMNAWPARGVGMLSSYRGFKACDSYANGEEAITQVTCPVLFVLGAQDQMTQAKAAEAPIAKARQSGKTVQVERFPVGHHQMWETPELTLFAMRDFLKTA